MVFMSIKLSEEEVKLLEKNAWPFQEATNILHNIGYKTPPKGYVLFETGYGPSGLPHIGTFGEVVRTIMVMTAFKILSNIPTKLFCVSDDMDGMRKIPDTIPNKEEYKKYIGLPLTAIPDPFGIHQSYGHNMNARLRGFLDHFGFKYEFLSSTECYKRGVFNEFLLKILEHYDEIMDIMLPTLGEERQKTYSPFLPICPYTGCVLQVPIVARNTERAEIAYINPHGDGEEITWVSILNGHCKLQWKPDFGMRWAAFDVDFEMYGKEHYTNGKIYTDICKALGGKGPTQMFYELFLDEQGEKISKSKGNGLTIDEWLRYAPKEGLALFMYIAPRKAKRLYFDVIPKYTDDYITYLRKYHEETDIIKKMTNPVFHIHNGDVPQQPELDVSYSLLVNLVNACNTDNESVIMEYLKKTIGYNAKSTTNNYMLKMMINGAINYYRDFVEDKKVYKKPNNHEREALKRLAHELHQLNKNQQRDAQFIQNMIYNVGNESGFETKQWFCALYEILLGASAGPRFGSFVTLLGIAETIKLIENKINGE